LGYPDRLKSDFPRFDFLKYPSLTFEQPDKTTFRCLNLAYDAMKTGGSAPCVMNAANEIAVAAFLEDRIPFLRIAEVIEETMQTVKTGKPENIGDYVAADRLARETASRFVKNM
jgi:1-deoxy-D-xylulose-5-phosphate reductoisomerase